MDDGLRDVIVGDRGVVLLGERELDERQVVQPAVELGELLLGVPPGGIANVTMAGRDLESHLVSFPVVLRLYPARMARAKVTTSTRAAPARRSAAAQASTVEPVV